MFNLFKKKSKKEKLQDRYRNLMAEAHRLSSINRRLGDEKIAEAEQVLKQIDNLGR